MMSDWTWKQAVADEILAIVNENKDPSFSLDNLYARENIFQSRFPRNRHVRHKIRQKLQQLRDIGLLTFLGGARYEVNMEFPELEIEPSAKEEEGILIPKTVTVVRKVRLRNTLLAADLKKRYRFSCQICRAVVQLVRTEYAEAHHIRPLGSPHFGPDVEGNILVVCPNHHVMLDRGAVSIDPQSLVVTHIRQAFKPHPLHVAPWHKLGTRFLLYHGAHIFGS